MKKVFGLIVLTAIFVLNGCKEIGPPIVLQAPPVVKGSKQSGLISDSTYIETSIPAADSKRVMMEEFSGQNCPNCPTGHAAVEQIIANNSGKISAATLHTNFFAPQSNPIAPVDFRTTFATDIINTYGAGAVGIPCAMIDRVFVGGTTNSTAILTPSTWSSYVATELTKTSYVNMVLSSNWDAAASQDSLTVALHFTSTVTADSLNLSLMITEDNIVAGQDSAGIILPNHVHNHILRTMITPSTGIKIAPSKVAGRVVIYKFRSDVIDITKWKLSNLKVIAFVHKQNSGVYDIVQVAEKTVQ